MVKIKLTETHGVPRLCVEEMWMSLPGGQHRASHKNLKCTHSCMQEFPFSRGYQPTFTVREVA